MTFNDLCEMGIFEQDLDSASILAETLGRNGMTDKEIRKLLLEKYNIVPWTTHGRIYKSKENLSSQEVAEESGNMHEKNSPRVS